MRDFFHPLRLAILLLASLSVANCSDDPAVNPDTNYDPSTDSGLYSIKDSFNEIDNYGGEISVTFVSFGAWSAVSDSDWCSVNISSGEQGNGYATFSIAPFVPEEEDEERIATITISVDGYGTDLTLCEIRQCSDVEDAYTSGLDPNLWISEYMTRNYLWNNEFISAKPNLNFYTDADTFFSSALSRMDNLGKIDEDGKTYSTGERYFYSTLTTYIYSSSYSATAPATRAFTTKEDYGINMVYPVSSPESGYYYFLIASMMEDSPADKAGLTRGMYITTCDKNKITGSNLETYYNALMGYTSDLSTITLDISQYKQVLGGSYELAEVGEFKVEPYSHTSNPVIFEETYHSETYDKTIAYLVYSEFDMNADDYLITVFENFKKDNPDDLILDLRYNSGGDVYSSAVLATSIIGDKYKGQTYCEMQYNDYRTALGEKDYFYIGQSPSMVEYPAIESASAASLNLDRVYVITTGFTASASELIINGLRGLGVEVILIGQTTEGKNVGMEVVYSASYSDYEFGEYLYELAPITFRNLNAEGFCDFSAGFEVDHAHVETTYILEDWGSTDYCVGAAITHICTGAWPNSSASAPESRAAAQLLPEVSSDRLRPLGRGSRVNGAETLREYNN